MDKVALDVAAAVSGIRDGATIAVGGFAAAGFPGDLMNALAETEVGDLHLIANGLRGPALDKLVAEDRIRKFSGGFVFGGSWNEPVFTGKIEVEILPQGTLAERLRAGGAGIAAFYTPTSIDTLLETGEFPSRFDENGEPIEFAPAKEVREFDGHRYVLEHGIKPDFGFVKATKADRAGNLVLRRTTRNFNPLIAMAARTTIAQAEEIVEIGELDPDEIHIPSRFVDIIVHVPKPAPEAEAAATVATTRPVRDAAPLLGFSRDEIAKCVGRDIQEGWCINLGVGMPILAAKYIDPSKDVVLHMENGILGAGGPPEVPDLDLTDAGGQPVVALPGAATFDSALSFALVRGGYLDLTVLGALQVSVTGDLANWYMHKGQTGVGGAMDLVQGAKSVWVTMEHTDRNGMSKIVEQCSFALTGRGVVDRIYTNLGVFALESGELILTELAPGVDLEYVRNVTGVPFSVASGIA